MIKDQLLTIKSTLPDHVTLVAVSKTKPDEDLLEAYEAGQRIFGENKVQEMVGKWERLPKDIKWHMIGHLQRNKVKYMAEFVDLVHGVDSFRLLVEINKRAEQLNRSIDCLLQIHIAEEDTKFGLNEEELNTLLKSDEYQQLKHVNVVGLMGMATFTDDETQIRREFKHLKSIFDAIQTENEQIKILSMGMSGDYKIAIEEGSTMVRIGSSIFGKRNY
ncbi:YggS family pyridoxal phosphate-dependent enzyme [Zobellia galactanivorans]|uniref:Pyridoxal phosphate homeostasis protein n=1 Tax=Zobellia galactanivorans (strain DSM 12802 / CCUG 47099 / CIP 106680 / NCIMB 13871 / Dsij) TaxID=63186 RepID=G0L4T3_ZOBGA|nr:MULTISPECIES: YggS family pyridoxal phosphate-dependent enzyme [Zobellia]MBU3027070.1 YggS family pyridoxal phosphate-dependent enzyme [Zobellia galactanivorans]MDO6808000.1 YggS family pyridoxal phosphate-dependent enzyme [Zobellia galactanivorans]OWW24898.1 YggS family pyridoxal phosphate enzyme [Zobellia sp. OII3]CAZ98888.1 Alpha/beta barrel fold protein [Zobellia galactanivorans]